MADTFQNQLVALLPAMKAFAVMLTRNRQSADDLVNDTVLRALRKEDLYAMGTNLKAWLFTIMRNIHINNIRAGQRSRARRDPFLQAPRAPWAPVRAKQESWSARDDE